MKIAIQSVLILVVIVLTYMVYNSINSKIQFEKEASRRKEVVVERLKDIRTAQVAFKTAHGVYSGDWNSLLTFVKEGKMPILRQIGDAEDSVAVAQGLVIRDTLFVSVLETVFSNEELGARVKPFIVDSLPYIPFSNNEKFSIASGEIEKNKVKVKVFEVEAKYKYIYNGLDIAVENVKPEEGLRVGSMTEPSTNGNWE